MTKIKMCGMMYTADVITAQNLQVDYVGFILSQGFRRSLTYDTFADLQSLVTDTSIKKVGVFVNESIEYVSRYLSMIDMIQLHGKENNDFIKALNNYTDKKIIKAFKIRTEYNITAAQNSLADHILLDSGEGSGKLFNHDLLNSIEREYFLAGGLSPENIEEVLKKLSPYAVDVSSGIETNGRKDTDKMKAFANAVRRIT